jgi:hypothetical protein
LLPEFNFHFGKRTNNSSKKIYGILGSGILVEALKVWLLLLLLLLFFQVLGEIAGLLKVAFNKRVGFPPDCNQQQNTLVSSGGRNGS